MCGPFGTLTICPPSMAIYDSRQWIEVIAIPMMSLAFLTPLDIQIPPEDVSWYVFGEVQIHSLILKNYGGKTIYMFPFWGPNNFLVEKYSFL